MILYNITVNIDHDINKEWLVWMKDIHIPDVLSTGLFIENKVAKIHAEEDGTSIRVHESNRRGQKSLAPGYTR